VALITLPVLCAALATILLEALLVGYEPASVNTMLPGWTYASATVMKICLLTGLVAAVIAMVNLARRRWFGEAAMRTASDDQQERTTNPANLSAKAIPIRSILSVALPPFAPLIGALAVVIAQTFVDKPDRASMNFISRNGVLVMMAWITASLILGLLARLKGERPHSLSMFGVVMSACLIVLFWYWQFYKLGFDQDRWAAP
jgi:Uncharacterized protein conserved in bacteria